MVVTREEEEEPLGHQVWALLKQRIVTLCSEGLEWMVVRPGARLAMHRYIKNP